MKRNNKGFTLIELLGAIVILGILIGISVPIIVSLLDTSRSKMYINDAKKLVAQAEYKLKSNSSDIEKPDEGDCILVSMVYLDSSDFDNPPNEGKYEKESSFVVVKNNGGKLEYAVTIVEKVKKGGYKGVELVKKSELTSSNSLSHVVSFKKGDLVNVENDVTRGYLNEKLGEGYISNDNGITAIYNYPDLADSSSNTDAIGTPRITLASLVSTSNKGYNSLDATLQLKAEDKDTARNQLKVYLAVDSGYESATTPIAYGDNDTFSYNFNFGDYGKGYDGSNVKVYIIVKDPEGNATKKTMTYKIHKNEKPEIDDTSTITKRNSDNLNMTTGLVKLEVSDDIDDSSTLSACLIESLTDEDFDSCNNYQRYRDYFSTENTMEYHFNACTGGCKRDGSTHYLTVFIKDSLGGIAKKKFSYTFSTNTAPTIKSLEVKSKIEEFTNDGSKTVVVNVNAEDDVDNADSMKVRVSDGTNSADYNYSGQPIYFDIDSLYDGSNKNITVSVIDSEGESTSRTESYTLYKNKKPKINSYSVTSANTVCTNQALCPPTSGGSKTVNIELEATDDIDYANDFSDLSVCVSLSDEVCNNYSSYSNYYNKKYTYEIPGDYDGTTKNVYVYVKDTYGEIVKQSVQYKVYRNQSPVIEYASFNSKTNGNPETNNLNTVFTINAYDDFDDVSDLKLQIVEDGNIKVDNVSLSDYIGHENNYTMSGTYDGTDRNIEVKVIDNDGLVTSNEVKYSVYNNKSPDVNIYNVYSKQIPCNNDKYCSIEESGNYNAYYKLAVSDDLDENSDIQICVSENDTCSDYSSYTNYLDNDGNPKEFNYVFSVSDSSKPYDGTVKHLYLYAKDSYGKVTKKDYAYALYKNQEPEILEVPMLVSNATRNTVHIPKATYSISAEDDIDSTLEIKYCYLKDGSTTEVCTNYEEYTESKLLDNTFFNTSDPSGETYVVYAKLKDSYGAVSTADPITYQLYNDRTPNIFYADIANGKTIYKNANGDVESTLDGIADPSQYTEYNRLKIKFSVDDPYDEFSICVSENSSTCTNYQGVYNGNACTDSDTCDSVRKTYVTYYDKLGSISGHDEINIYLFVKDSYGKTDTYTVHEGYYSECLEKDEEGAIYEYELNTEASSEPISIDRCEGKCYYYNPTTGEEHDIHSYYKAKITYTDKYNSSIVCNNGNPVVNTIKATCDFKDCFYKNNNYNRKAIGTTLIEDDDEVWTAEVDGDVYTCTGHYDLYLSSYNEGNKNITLTKTNTKICKEAFDDGKYNYIRTSNDPYVLVAD